MTFALAFFGAAMTAIAAAALRSRDRAWRLLERERRHSERDPFTGRFMKRG